MSSRIPEEPLKVTIIGKPDFKAIPEVKLELFAKFCMESLDDFYHHGGKERAEAKRAAREAVR